MDLFKGSSAASSSSATATISAGGAGDSVQQIFGGKIGKSGNKKIDEDNKAIADKNTGLKQGQTPQAERQAR